MRREVRTLDVDWTDGEIPPPLQIQLTEADLSGWSLGVTITKDGVEAVFAGTVAWADASTGIAEVTWGAGDVDLADPDALMQRTEVQVWASGAGQLIASMPVVNWTFPAVGTVPL